MTLPVSGQTLSRAYVYQLDLGVTVGTLANVTALQLLTPPNAGAGTTLTFGTDAGSGSETVTYTNQAGAQVTQVISTTNDLQSPTAFTYTSGGITYVVSNGPVTPSNLADITSGNLTALVGGLGDVNLVAGAQTYVACYAAGTLISVPDGKVAVETLSAGDLVLTATGDAKPVRWIGQRAYSGRFLKGRPHLLPVLLRTGSLGGGLPTRDLRVSPRHAMFLDGVLVPAEALVNGVTIVRDSEIERIDYFHVELDAHDLIFAEDAVSESYIDDNSRMMFHNAETYRELHPEAVPAPVVYCAPRVSEGWQLAHILSSLPRAA